MQKVIRFYPNLGKMVLLLLGSIVLMLAGYFVLQHSQQPQDYLIGVLSLVFFGFTGLVFFAMLFTTFRPMLVVSADGFQSHFFFNSKVARWQDVATIYIARLSLPRGGPIYWLIVAAKDPSIVRQNNVQRFNRFYPQFAHALLYLPLTMLFIHTTQHQCEHLLQRIESVFPGQIAVYNVTINRELEPMTRVK